MQAKRAKKGCDLFICSATDIGVMRNGGKRGARFSPETILNLFSKMIAPEGARHWSHESVSCEADELADFQRAQASSADKLQEALNHESQHIIHLGGGHDHIYPLALAWSRQHPEEKLVIINIDAHLDTRTDELGHSGTPFRQIQKEMNNLLHLYQLGIHSYANVAENYENMASMEVAPSQAEADFESWIETILNRHKNDQLILSLDCDGLDQSFMPAVSAPNHNGLGAKEMNRILGLCQNHWRESNKTPIFGLYEYNPVFDNINATAGRYLTSLIHQLLYG